MTIIVLTTLALILAWLYAVYAHTFVWRKHYHEENKYRLRKEKSDLIYLIATGRLTPDDEFFTRTYGLLDSFEDVCGHFSLKHVVGIAERTSEKSLDEPEVHRLSGLLQSKPKDVQEVFRNSYQTIGRIILQNSLTISVSLFLARKAFIRFIFNRLPDFVKTLGKNLFSRQWEIIRTLLTFEEGMNLRIS
jgi:hypothetical protein